MYRPKHFDQQDRSVLLEIMNQNSFATVITHDSAGLTANHFPLMVEEREGKLVLLGHLAKANSQWKHFEQGASTLVIFHGPHTYISPSWYGPGPQVPTWNYAAVHAYGKAQLLGEEATYSILERMVQKYESKFPQPWQLELPEGDKKGMLRAIVGFEIHINRLEGKLKLSQNREKSDQQGVVRALSVSDDPMDRAVAELMKKHTLG